MGWNDQRGDRWGERFPFRSRLPRPIIRPNDRVVDFRARRTRSARSDDWTESFEWILSFRIPYFGTRVPPGNTLSTNNRQRNELISTGIIKFRVFTLSRRGPGCTTGAKLGGPCLSNNAYKCLQADEIFWSSNLVAFLLRKERFPPSEINVPI